MQRFYSLMSLVCCEGSNRYSPPRFEIRTSHGVFPHIFECALITGCLQSGEVKWSTVCGVVWPTRCMRSALVYLTTAPTVCLK